MPAFELVSKYQPTGDQPRAIEELIRGLKRGEREQTLLGVTGSGKTFTMANLIQNVGKPTLILAHNKTLAAQLYAEFREFFPKNEVHYFVHTSTITSQKPISLRRIPTLKKIQLSTRKLTVCVMPLRLHF